jgi:phosphopantothenoylcysteine decarboxylase/phosphopantothenate--cysteine ligase
MTTPLKDTRILLGVTGSIACYKAVDLASKLHQSGALVDVVLTQSAEQFLSPLTFQSLTGRPAYTDSGLWGAEGHVLHVGLAQDAELLVIAPITANTIAKIACGIADNLLTLTVLAAGCPVIIAPAMDGGMYSNPATQSNLEILKTRGVIVVGPAEGHLASGLTGLGRMLETQSIFGHVRHLLSREGILKGRKFVVTAGPTQEPIDPVRFISNFSSGKQGFALAQAALDKGAKVTLIAGPVNLSTPIGVDRIDVKTSMEMNAAVLAEVKDADALVMAAAVSDYSPKDVMENKSKKGAGNLSLNLKMNPDILSNVSELRSKTQKPAVCVGFSAESQNLKENAKNKMLHKNLDLMVANDITASDSGFNVNTNRVTLLYPDGRSEDLPLMSKFEVADTVMERIAIILSQKAGQPQIGTSPF